MMLILLLAGVAILLVVLLWRLLRGQSGEVGEPQELIGRVRAVDLEAFRNLTDEAEEDFLRQRLPAPEFRRVQRQRNRAALQYARWVGQNAAIVLRLGEAARQSSNPEVARAGEDLVRLAISVRAYVLLASMTLAVGVLLPGTRISSGRVAHSYERLRRSLDTLIRMEQPGSAGRVMAGL